MRRTVAEDTTIVVAPLKLYEIFVTVEHEVASVRIYVIEVPRALVAYFAAETISPSV